MTAPTAQSPPLVSTLDVSALNRRGMALQAQGRVREAAAAFEQAARLAPDKAALWANLGSASMLSGALTRSRAAYERALALAPQDDAIRVRLALAILAECEAVGTKSAAAAARAAELLAQMAGRVQGGSMTEPALASLRPLWLLAQARLDAEHRHDRARARRWCEQALALDPDWPAALQVYAEICAVFSEPQAASDALERALRAQPGDPTLFDRHLYALQYDPRRNARELAGWIRQRGQAQRDKGKAEEAKAEKYPPQSREITGSGSSLKRPVTAALPGAGRRLRIAPGTLALGFVSGDFREHPCGDLIEGLFRALSRDRVRVVAYSNHRAVDARTRVLRALVDEWHLIAGLDTGQLRARIRDDGIDVLIDLSGLTRYNRLDVFATRSAPLQLSWLGYHAGTGLETVDAFLIDAAMSRGLQPFYREKLVDLPWSFNQPAASLPDVDAALACAPCERNGFVTFGSLNNPVKCNDAVFDAWAMILRELPDARLAHRYRFFTDESVVAAFRAQFTARGVDAGRIDCLPALPQARALTWLAEEVDVGLDPFPHGSHTTGLQSLAMGVPLVTLLGEQVVGRVCAVFERRLGLDAFVAHSVADYVSRAVEIGRCRETLPAIRRDCRRRALASPLLDENAFARIFEEVVFRLF